jgi:hypothetical protein
MSFGAVPLIAASAIVSAEIAGGLNVLRAAANGTEAALVLRKVRRLSMRSLWPIIDVFYGHFARRSYYTGCRA